MSDQMADVPDVERLVSEISALRGKVAQLQERVEQLDLLAHQDSLIDLPNRRGFVRQLERLLARLDRYGETSAMLYVDVDGLKQINDSHGHAAGDAALIHVAKLLNESVRTTDCVGRLGGDEFGVLLTRVNEAEANETAARLLERMELAEFIHESASLSVSCAIGVAMLERGETAASVIERADRAMYADKAAA